MPDETKDLRAGSDKTTTSVEQHAADSAMQALLDEVWSNLAKWGIGPRATLPQESSTLPKVDLLPDTPTTAATADSSAKPLLELPPPPTRIETADVTMDIYPTVNPGKKEVEINVSGEF